MKTLMRCLRAVLIVFIACAAIAGGLTVLRHALLWKPSLESVAAQANQLIAAAGGPTKVCNEADKIFARFGMKSKFLRSRDLNDCPALDALGREHGVVIFPPCISIHIGGHNGFFITIYSAEKPTVPDEAELFGSRVFVHQ
jgi:hypothetical protein